MALRTLFAACLATALPCAFSITSGQTATEPTTESLASVIDDCRGMRLAEQGRKIEDVAIKLGHLEVTFAEGTLVPVLGKRGSILGAYFEGRGGYVYSPGDLPARSAMEVNVARISNSLRPLAGRLLDQFKRVLVLYSDPTFRTIEDLQGEAVVAPESMRAGFMENLQAVLYTYAEFEFRTALVRLNGKGNWVYLELSGGLEHVGYVYDDVLYGREWLTTFRTLGDDNIRVTPLLTQEDLPGWDAARRQTVVLRHADIALATDDNKSGSIDSTLVLRVRGAGTRAIVLDLMSHRDPDADDWFTQRRRLEVRRVLDASGRALSFSHERGEIIVEIPPTADAESEVVLRFETFGEVLVDMTWQHVDNYFALMDDWYPAPTGWAGQQFTFTLKARVRKPWRPVTSGREVSIKDDGTHITTEARSDHPSMNVAVLAGKYFTSEQTVDALKVRVHAYAWNRKTVLDNMPKLAVALHKFYTGLLGPIPIDELDIVEIPAYGFGIAPAGMVLLTSEAYANVHTKLASGINARLAHEIAHQWFGHRAVPTQLNDHWLAESFAEYFAGIAIGTLAANEKTLKGFPDMLIDWRTEARQCSTGGTVATADYLGARLGMVDRACLLYSRGPLVLHMLRTSIGNAPFARATRKYLDAASGGPVTTRDFTRAVSETVGQDMSWFFDQWVYRPGDAQIDIEQHVERAVHGQYRLWGTIRQSPGDGFKKLLVPLVWESGGEKFTRVVFADQPEKEFDFVVPFKPGVVKPDPYQNNLAVYK